MKKKRFVDLSISIEADLPSDPPMMVPKIQYIGHEEGAESMMMFFPGLKKEDLPGGKGWAVEMVELTTHSGTHLDAPWHYHPEMDGGSHALTIDEVPLEWCMGDGVVLDFRHFADGYKVMPGDMKAALDKIGYALKPGDIVLVMTGADRYWGKPEYMLKGCGMGRDATLWLRSLPDISSNGSIRRRLWTRMERYGVCHRREVPGCTHSRSHPGQVGFGHAVDEEFGYGPGHSRRAHPHA